MKNANVIRPAYNEENSNVTVTATVTFGDVTKTISFPVLVKREGITDSQATIVDLNAIKLPAETKENILLPTEGANGSTITWTSNKSNINKNGHVTRPNVGEDDVTVTLTAVATKGSFSEQKDFEVLVKAWTEVEELDHAVTLINWELIKGDNSNNLAIVNDLVLPKTVGRNVAAKWTTPTSNCNVDTGKITRPTYVQGPVELILTCTLTHGSLKKTVVLPQYIIAAEDMTPQDVLNMAKNVLEASSFLGENSSLNSITSNMKLPVRFNEAELSLATITWSLANKVGTSYNDTASHNNIALSVQNDHVLATVTRPGASDGNKLVSLKAKITVDDGSTSVNDTKYFDLTILVS